MNRLPAEVLSQIFCHLGHHQKAKCKQVSRQWAHAIDPACLFHTMRVSTDMSLFKLLQSVNRNPDMGHHVKRLVCNLYMPDHHFLSMLPRAFPHLQVVCFEECEPDIDLEPLEYHPWTESIQVFVETESDLMATQLLGSGKCLELRTLVIKEYGDSLVDEDDTSTIFDLLVNAPLLTTLTLIDYAFTLNDLNVLHSGLPCLKSISLIECILTDTTVTGKIVPAPSVKVLVLDRVIIYTRQHEFETDLLRFISMKYPNLVEMQHISCTYYHELPPESYDGIRSAWLTLLNALGSRLKSLKLPRKEIGLPMWDLLDQAGCQLQKLGLCLTDPLLNRNVPFSNQMSFIQTLVIENHHTIKYQWLKDFKQLKKLKWIFDRGSLFSLDDIICAIPDTLEALSLKSAPEDDEYTTLTLSPTTTPLFSIKSISLCNIAITSEIEYFLVHIIPNLNRLKLHKCRMDTHSLSLPRTRFTLLKISSDFPAMSRDVKLTTHNETRRYRTKCRSVLGRQFKCLFDDDTSMYPSVDVPTDYLHFDPYISITCFSIQDLVIIDHT